MPGPIAKLSPELLGLILSFATADLSRYACTSILLVCKQWLAVGEPIVWASVYLTHATLKTFTNLAVHLRNPMSHIKSLTLNLHTLWPAQSEILLARSDPQTWPEMANPGTAAQWRDLDRLALLIQQRMTGLTSFSLQIARLPEGGRTADQHNSPAGAWMRSATLKRLLESLPTSCTALELDTRGRDDAPVCGYRGELPSFHLCPVIRSLLPRLKHLRLRLGRLCPELFTLEANSINVERIEATSLRSLSINLNLLPDAMGVVQCPPPELPIHLDEMKAEGADSSEPDESDMDESSEEDEESEEDEIEDENDDVVAGHDDQGRARVSVFGTLHDELRAAFQANCYPKIATLQLLQLESTQLRQHDHFRLLDIIKDEVHILPFRLIAQDSKNVTKNTFLARSMADEQSIGGMVSLEDWVEGETWVTALSGARLPAMLAAGQRRRSEMYPARCELTDEYSSRPVMEDSPAWARDTWEAANESHASIERLR